MEVLAIMDNDRDQTWISMHLHLLGPEGSIVSRAWKVRTLTAPEGPSRLCISKHVWSLFIIAGAGQNIPGQNIPCHFFTPRTKHPTKICHPGQNIPRCFRHPGHNIPCHFCHPGHNIPCHFCHPGQNIPYSDCFFRVSLICDLHLLWHVLAVNALVWLSKWYKLDLKLIERQFHTVNRI